MNHRFLWDMVLVNDGDDQSPSETGREKTSLEMVRSIAASRFPDLLKSGQLQFNMLPQAQREAMNSRKGGAITKGFRLILDRSPDTPPEFIVWTDADRTVHLGLEGVMFPYLKDPAVGMCIGSTEVHGGKARGFHRIQFL